MNNIKTPSDSSKKKELSAIFKFFLFVLGIMGLVFLLNGPIKSNFGYESITAMATNGPPGQGGNPGSVTTRQPRVIQPKNIDTLKKKWTLPLTPAPAQNYIGNLEKKILDESNRHRASKQAPPVTWEGNLADTARYHSSDMGTRDFFSHINPDNVGPFFRISKLHRRYIGTGGENILKITKDNSSADQMAKKIVDLWMNSTGHRQNILNKDYTALGVGVVEAMDKSNTPFIYATQLFGTPIAYLQQDFPLELTPGQEETVSVQVVHNDYHAPVTGEIIELGSSRAQKFQLTDEPGSNRVRSTGKIRVPAKTGVYQLVFHFPFKNTPGTLAVAPGPIFNVK